MPRGRPFHPWYSARPDEKLSCGGLAGERLPGIRDNVPISYLPVPKASSTVTQAPKWGFVARASANGAASFSTDASTDCLMRRALARPER